MKTLKSRIDKKTRLYLLLELENCLKELIQNGDEDVVNEHATAFKNMLGEEKCKELARLLKDSLSTDEE